MIQLKEFYKDKVIPDLKEKLGLKSSMAVPRITKVTLNMGVGEANIDKKALEKAVEDLTLISGQKPLITKTRKSVASFKIRDGVPIGCKITLRKNRMYEFIDRLVNIALPRVKDFRGLSPKGFDKFGNYTFGIKEHIIFPEVNFDKVEKIRGLDITLVIKSIKKEDSFALLKKLNFPFRDMRDN